MRMNVMRRNDDAVKNAAGIKITNTILYKLRALAFC